MAGRKPRPETSRRGRQDASAVIVAGGQGTRFGGTIRKQYLRLNGRPILWWSLQAFEKSPSFTEIILIVPPDDVVAVTRRCRQWRFRKLTAIAAGGATRADSVRAGIHRISRLTAFVAIHDAVRPLITSYEVERVLTQARRTHAAIAAVPSKDTVKFADAHDRILSTPPRERTWLAQTPQIFERKLIERAHGVTAAPGSRLKARGVHPRAWSREPGAAVTDDAQLVERMGVRVSLVRTSPENIKVTQPMDLAIARLILQSRTKPRKG